LAKGLRGLSFRRFVNSPITIAWGVVPQHCLTKKNGVSERSFALILSLAVAALASLTACQPQTVLTPPANGTYCPGQILTFKITFPTWWNDFSAAFVFHAPPDLSHVAITPFNWLSGFR
jgi:hypothetical protein